VSGGKRGRGGRVRNRLSRAPYVAGHSNAQKRNEDPIGGKSFSERGGRCWLGDIASLYYTSWRVKTKTAGRGGRMPWHGPSTTIRSRMGEQKKRAWKAFQHGFVLRAT